MNVFSKVTLRTLGKNRVRTLVTIIGIILSAAMITAVTTSISSLQNYLVNVSIERSGNWHGVVYGLPKAEVEALQQETRIKTAASLQIIGYASLDGGKNIYKPYLYVAGMSENFSNMMPVNLTSGRMPENPSEIILPTHVRSNGGVSYAIGDSLSLAIGNRVAEGNVLSQNTGFLDGEEGITEELEVDSQRSYTLVGFFERPTFEDYAAPGFTALTIADGSDQDPYEAYINLESPRTVYSFLEERFSEYGSSTNTDLLRFIGASNERSFNAVLYGLAAVLIALIMFGSISLIYNAFSISVSERTIQFGLLSSIGATRRQLMQSVLYEALFLSLVGIPLGILAGIAGIAVTFSVASEMFNTFLFYDSGVSLGLFVSWPALLAALVVALATVLISAYLPARRAVRVSAIDAIRQAGDIAVEAKKVKTSRLTYRLFGFEGMLASKNFRRNNKKYRATVVSLFLSVVLFISASSFCAYLAKSADSVMQPVDFDVTVTLGPADWQSISLPALFEELSALEGVTDSGYAAYSNEIATLPKEWISQDYLDYINRGYPDGQPVSETLGFSTMLYFVDDRQYEKFVTENSLFLEIDSTATVPEAVALDFMKTFDGQEERYYTFNLLNRQSLDLPLHRYKTIDGFHLQRIDYDDDGTEIAVYQNEDGEQIRLSATEAKEDIILPVATVTDQKPFVVRYNDGGLTLIYPFRAMEQIINRTSTDVETTLYFKADNHKAVYERVARNLEEKGLNTTFLSDYADRAESERAMIAVVNIFSYGFIVLISLIAAANVFNTISTNIGLRRREFAMLKSIGMTQKGFTKMMNYECLLYGFKGLVFGIPVSFGVTYLIYRSVQYGLESQYFVPWYSVAIAIGSVFVVVFSTMIYSMSRIKKDNLIDALRNENL